MKISYIVLILTVSMTFLCYAGENKQKIVKNGVVDLKDIDFKKTKMIRLDGEWEFYWNKLMVSSEIDKEKNSKRYIDFPKSWGMVKIDGKKLSYDGYATFRIKIKNIKKDTTLALRFSKIFTAYRVFINGVDQGGVGIVGKSIREETPHYFPKIFPITKVNGDVEIVLQISNFHENDSGVWESIQIGEQQEVMQNEIKKKLADMFFAGAVLVIGVYCFILYLVPRKDKFLVIFGLYCVLISLRIVSSGAVVIYDILPQITHEIVRKMEYFTLYTGATLFLIFISHLYPQHVASKALIFSRVVGIISGATVILMPAKLFSKLLVFNELLIVVTGIYIIYILIKAIKNKQEGSIFIFIGTSIMYVSCINDMIYINAIAKNKELFPAGIAVFVLMYSFVLSIRSTKIMKIALENEHQYLLEKEKKESAEKLLERKEKSLSILKIIENISKIIFLDKDKLKTINYTMFMLASGFEIQYRKVIYFEYQNELNSFVLKSIFSNVRKNTLIYENDFFSFFNKLIELTNNYKESEKIKEKELPATEEIMNKLKKDCIININSKLLKLTAEDENLFVCPVIYNDNMFGMIVFEKENSEIEAEEMEIIKIFSNNLSVYFEKIRIRAEKIARMPNKEFRCNKCHKKLFAYKGEADFVEVKCPTCNTFNIIGIDGIDRNEVQ